MLDDLGATTVDPSSAEPVGDERVDVVFDAAGAGSAFTSAIGRLAPGGRLVVVAVHEHPTEFNPTQLLRSETEVVGSLACLPEDFVEVIDAMAQGGDDTTGWVSQLPLDDVVDAIEHLRAGTTMKCLLSISTGWRRTAESASLSASSCGLRRCGE